MKSTKSLSFKFILSLIPVVVIISCSSTEIKLEVTPGELAERMINNPDFVKNANGEAFCWHARVDLDRFVENYKLTKDEKWLDAGIRYYDFITGKMIIDPDGYKGWIGKYNNTGYWQDAVVGEAILFEGILNFSVLILEDNSLKNKYGKKAIYYSETAKKHLIEKWDKRGCWIDDGPFGAYIEFNKFLKEDSLKKWIVTPELPEPKYGVSIPFNKQMSVGAVCLRLYRITGDKIYRERAEKIFLTFKSRLQYFSNHYCWNYFEPLYPGDVDLTKNVTRHGVWVHPWRSGYQADEVEGIAEAYHYGIVFDEQDIKRIINTNLDVMWNKDNLNPKFINSNGLGADGDTAGIAEFQEAFGFSNAVKNGGELWTGLLDFDQRIRDIYEARFKKSKESIEYIR